ncbi:MAG: hypothetical protein ACKO1F_04655 [Flammeovirgaceae bacterium]
MNETASIDYHHLLCFEPSKVKIVHVEKLNEHSKIFHYQNRIKKLLFFLVREGLFTTIRKIFSAKKLRRLEDDYVFIIAEIEPNLFASGFQHSLTQSRYYFEPSSLSPSSKPSDFNKFRKRNPFVSGTLPPNDNQILQDGAKYIFLPIEVGSVKSIREFNFFMIGCGDYPRTQVLPIFKTFTRLAAIDFNTRIFELPDVSSFQLKSNDFDSIFRYQYQTAQINLAVIASYHSYHTTQCVQFLKRVSNSIVIIEKPPCVTKHDLELLSNNFDSNRIFIGYNRRFIPWNHLLRKKIRLSNGPFILQILVNEVQITESHWYYAENQGTRVTGNLCHWIDLCVFLLERTPTRLSIGRNSAGLDNSVFNIHFEDGSIASMIATEFGDGTFGVQEKIAIKSRELDVLVDDYTSMRIWDKGKTANFYSIKRDKGHRTMYKTFLKQILSGKTSNYSREHLVYSSYIYISFVELFNSNKDSCDLDFSVFLKLK